MRYLECMDANPTPYTLGPWERDGAWAWVRCWQRPGDPGRPVAASVSTLPQLREWEVLAHAPSGTVRQHVDRGRGALDRARRLAGDCLRAAWPGLTRPATDFEVNDGR